MNKLFKELFTEFKPNRHKDLLVEIRSNGSQFMVYDVKNNQLLAGERFGSIDDALSFVDQNQMMLIFK